MPLKPEDFYDDLVRWEGCCTWMYLDNRGLVTTGVGNLLATPDDAVKLEWWTQGGTPVGADEVRRAWAAVKASQPAVIASWYQRLTSIRLAPSDAKDIALSRLATEFVPGISRAFPGFEDMPTPAQRCLVDMAYNMGVAGLSKFTHLRDAIAHHNWDTAAAESHVSTSRPERNAWREQLFKSIS